MTTDIMDRVRMEMISRIAIVCTLTLRGVLLNNFEPAITSNMPNTVGAIVTGAHKIPIPIVPIMTINVRINPQKMFNIPLTKVIIAIAWTFPGF